MGEVAQSCVFSSHFLIILRIKLYIMLLGEFAWSRKAPVRFVMSACLSVCPHVSARLPQHEFTFNLIVGTSVTICRETESCTQLYTALPTANIQLYTALPTANIQLYAALPTANIQLYTALSTANIQLYTALPTANIQLYTALHTANIQLYTALPTANIQLYTALSTANIQLYTALSTANIQL
jgi:hypothetical protein